MSPVLTIDVFDSDGVVVLTLEGEIDATVCHDFEMALKRGVTRAGRALVLDLGGVTFIDSVGLWTLIAAGRQARHEDIRFAIGRSSAAVHDALARFGMEESFFMSLGAQSENDPKEVRT